MVVRPVFQCEEDFFRLQHLETGVVRAGDLRPVQKDPDFRTAAGVHQNAALHGAGEDKISAAGQNQILIEEVGAASGHGGGAEIDRGGRGAVPVPGEVVAGKVARFILLVAVGNGLYSEPVSKHEQRGKQDRQQEHGNADLIDMFVR